MEIIPTDFDIDNIDDPDKDQLLLKRIKGRVSELLEKDPGLLMSYLYRLDIDEEMVQKVIHPNSLLPVSDAIATLIFERQKKRWESKKKYIQKPIDGWESF